MKVTKLKALFEAASRNEILSQAELSRGTFQEMLLHPQAGEMLDDFQDRFGSDELALLLETIAGITIPLEEEDAIIPQCKLGIAFRCALLQNLPPHLLIFEGMFGDIPRLDANDHAQLLLQPDVEAACSPIHSADATPSATPETKFTEAMVAHGLTPSVIYQAVECITTEIRTKMAVGALDINKSITITYRRGRYRLNQLPSLDLAARLAAECGLARQVATCLLDWLIKVARCKPFLFRLLKGEAKKKGVLLRYKEGYNNTNLFERWTCIAERTGAIDLSDQDFEFSSNEKEMLDILRHTDRSFNKEDLLGLSYKMGRKMLSRI